MGGEDEPKNNQNIDNNNTRDDDNPFVAFRRYADEQISSMLQSVMGLPSGINHPSTDKWTIFSEDHGYQNATRQGHNESNEDSRAGNQTGNSTSYNGNSSTSKHGSSEFDDSWHTHLHRRRNQGPFDFFSVEPFDKFWLDDHFPSSRFFHPYQNPFFQDAFNDNSPGWPVTYLMFSPYSPLHLERHRSHEQGVFSSLLASLRLSDSETERDPAEPHWREAFEDLLRLENGKPMLDREPAKGETARDWMEGMLKRGSLGDGWKFRFLGDNSDGGSVMFQNYNSRKKELPERENEQTESADESAPATELDMYERFLDDIESREREFPRGFPESPLIRFLLEDRQRFKDQLDNQHKFPSETDDTENWLELVSGGNKHSVPDTTTEKPEPSTTEKQLPESAQPRVVSTSTRTERIRLRDGSVQTKTVQTKRFADGREESNENVEVVNPSEQSQDWNQSSNKKSGWFWKE